MDRPRQGMILLVFGLALLLALFSALPATGQEPRRPTLTPSPVHGYLPLLIGIPEATPTATPTASPTPPSGPTPIPPDDPGQEEIIAVLIERERQARELSPLAVVPELTQSARRHSRNMADEDFTGHTGRDGSTPGDRMREAGYEWSYWGEIIAWGFGGDPEAAFEWWMNSSVHRGIILSPNYEDDGVGYATNPTSTWKHYWTVNFGRKAGLRAGHAQPRYVCTFTVEGEHGGSSLTLAGETPCADLQNWLESYARSHD